MKHKKEDNPCCMSCGDYTEEVEDEVYFCKKCDEVFTGEELMMFWKKNDEHDDYDRLTDNDF